MFHLFFFSALEVHFTHQFRYLLLNIPAATAVNDINKGNIFTNDNASLVLLFTAKADQLM
jgi:hypothetical protein